MSFWTCFAYEGIDPNELHCTHKYLGNLTSDQVTYVTALLDFYFRQNPYKTWTEDFFLPADFGRENNIRVLLPENYENYENYLWNLRKQLDEFRVDDFEGYVPHVTTQADRVNKPLTRYCFMEDLVILKEYK